MTDNDATKAWRKLASITVAEVTVYTYIQAITNDFFFSQINY